MLEPFFEALFGVLEGIKVKLKRQKTVNMK